MPLPRPKAQGETSLRQSGGYSGVSLSSMYVYERRCLLYLTYNPVDRFLVSLSPACLSPITIQTCYTQLVTPLRGESLPGFFCLALNLILLPLSPYVIAINRAGIKVLPHIINAAVFTSAFSAGNSFLYSSSRVLYGLSVRGQAPKIFGQVTKNGLPLISVAFCVSLFRSFRCTDCKLCVCVDSLCSPSWPS